MRGLLPGILCLVALVSIVTPAAAHSRFHHRDSHSANWAERDTATYVVSTLNLIRTPNGRSVASQLKRHFGVRTFEVFADTEINNLYFIELDKSNGGLVAAFAYQLGWERPAVLFSHVPLPPVREASHLLLQSYLTDKKVLIGRFTSTMPPGR